MGNLLDKPVTTKDSVVHTIHGLQIGVSSMQGWRVDMEDRHVVSKLSRHDEVVVLGVFDGHAGTHTAQVAAERLVPEIDQFFAQQTATATCVNEESLIRCLPTVFFAVDETVRVRGGQTQIESNSSDPDQSGATALVAVISPSHVIVANAGDSRAVLAHDGNQFTPMSADHKPALEAERQRIEGAGGIVVQNRVFGSLAVSRAMGDFAYKDRPDLPPDEQKVTALPDVKSIPRQHSAHEFLVLACDGVWDVMSSEEVCVFVRECLLEGERDPKVVCEELLDHCCLDLNSKDNLTAVVCLFEGAVFGDGPGIGERRERRLQEQASAQRTDSLTSEDLKAETFVGFS